LGAHADAVGAGSALGLVRSLVRRVAGLRDGTPAEEQYKRLQDYVAARLPPIDVARVTEFLGELSGAPTPSAPSAMLRAARTDPREMQEAMQSAFIDWLGAESATRPVLVVIEDLHWGDTPSVTYLGKALIHLTDRPLMFLALGRPEVSHLFPHLRDESRAQELTLGRLSRKAAERVARAALGDTIAPDRVAQIVERADGNPFYLEELVRHLAEGGRGDLPETVLSAAALRLEGLEPEARRTLRAASIFGQTSWAAGVATLLGQLDRSGDVEAQLRWLVEREVLVPGRGEKFPEQAEYGFRHALLREAAYAMLTDADKARGHRLAGDWLERTGERDGLVLGEHFERGGEPLRAVPWIRRAAQAALDGGQWDAAADLAERGIRNGAQGEPRAALRIIEAQAHNLMRAWARGRECAAEAMSLSPIAGVPWFRAASLAVIADATLAERTATLEVIEALASLPADLPATGPFAFAVMVLNSGLLSMGQRDLALSLLRRLEDTARTATEADPSFAGWLRLAQAHAALYAGEDLGAALTGAENALQLLDAAADSLGRVIAKLDLGTAYCEAGRFEDGTKLLREVVALAEPSGAVFLRDWAVFFIARSGWYLRGGTAELDTLQRLADGADFFIAAAARAVIARAHLVLGDSEEAGRRARLVLESASFLPTVEGEALSVIALVELAAGRPKEALTAADLGLTRRREQGGLPTETSELFLTRARALAALGRREEADAAFAEARDRVTRLAATLTEPASRNRYLHDVLANAQTIAGPVHTGGATG
jgi:tetratricopeptide (TPR) repeat protein